MVRWGTWVGWVLGRRAASHKRVRRRQSWSLWLWERGITTDDLVTLGVALAVAFAACIWG